MKDGIKGKKKNKLNDRKQTLDYIFNIDQREVFDNELSTLKENMEINELNAVKNSAMLNFILYKSNELSYHAKLGESLKSSNKNSIVSEYLEKENFKNSLRHIAKYMNDYHIKDAFKDEVICKNKMEVDKIENVAVKTEFETEVDQFLYYQPTAERNHNDNDGNVLNENNIPNLKQGINCENRYKNDDRNILKKKIIYKLKIFYLDGSDNSAQLCNIETHEEINFESFINQLKKQLGIYEYAKFKILLLEHSNYNKIFLQELSQLRRDEINEIKIIPN